MRKDVLGGLVCVKWHPHECRVSQQNIALQTDDQSLLLSVVSVLWVMSGMSAYAPSVYTARRVRNVSPGINKEEILILIATCEL